MHEEITHPVFGLVTVKPKEDHFVGVASMPTRGPFEGKVVITGKPQQSAESLLDEVAVVHQKYLDNESDLRLRMMREYFADGQQSPGDYAVGFEGSPDSPEFEEARLKFVAEIYSAVYGIKYNCKNQEITVSYDNANGEMDSLFSFECDFGFNNFSAF